MPAGKLLIYLLRRDLRVADNPILNQLSNNPDHGFDFLLPLYVFPRKQIELSGFLESGAQSPYPPAVSDIGKFWRCGPHRAKFLAEAVWDLKNTLEVSNSGLDIRVGEHGDIVRRLIQHFKSTDTPVGAVWMTEEVSVEEIKEQDDVQEACTAAQVDFRLWADEKYFIDDRDTGLETPEELPDVFTTYRKTQEPLRQRPRTCLITSTDKLPPYPKSSSIPRQHSPFETAASLDDLIERLRRPLIYDLDTIPTLPAGTESSHPFLGGEQPAFERLVHLVKSGVMNTYSDTRNGLLGTDFSTKLSAYLSFGCITARQIHEELLKLEDGSDDCYKDTAGYGEGENEGTKAVRFELLWRDYMRLCTKKFGHKLFMLSGFRQDAEYNKKWKTPNAKKAQADQDPTPDRVDVILRRFLSGMTGMGLIDAAQRELYLTGYTSNRTRQNVASFFAKHLLLDWRYGAEWYESLLTDYDVSSNWANWQYVSGVGNDPRGDARIFNPVKQAFDYDKEGSYVRAWVPEVSSLDKIENIFQPWTASAEDLEKAALSDSILVTDPLKRIEFTIERKPRSNRRPYTRGRGRGNARGGMQNQGQPQPQAVNFPTGHMAPMPPPNMVPMAGPPAMYSPVPYEASPPYAWNQPAPIQAQWGAGPPMAQPPQAWNSAQLWYGENMMASQAHMGSYRGRGGFGGRAGGPGQNGQRH